MKKEDLEETLIQSIQFDTKTGLVPVVVQEVFSNEILMLAYANREALDLTLTCGYATFWTRSRNKIWKKGESSGDLLKISEILVDCDQDTLIYRVSMEGKGACHTKDERGLPRKSCFYRKVLNDGGLEYLGKRNDN